MLGKKNQLFLASNLCGQHRAQPTAERVKAKLYGNFIIHTNHLNQARRYGVALMKADIPSALMAFPGRYTHSPFETGHLADIEAMVDWLYAFVTSAEGIS